MGKSRTNSEQTRAWIYNPWVDLIVGCGAWSAPLLLLSYSAMASSTRAWSVAFYALALFFNYPHYMATIYRAYHRAEDFEKYRIFTVHTTALILLTLVVSHYWAGLLPWIFTVYITWSPWHYSGQNYGLFMMFARRAGADPDKGTRQALYAAFIASYLILFLGFHTGTSRDPLFRSLGIPLVASRWEQLVLGAGFVLFSAYGLLRLARQTGWRKLLPSLTLYSSQILWFLAPAAISFLRKIDIPQSRYSTGVLAVMHSAQYLWITSYYARREADGDAAEKARSLRPLAYFGVLIVGGIALFVPGPWLASRGLHMDFSTSFLIFTSLINIHHFILDGAIWKLRDGRIAALLLNSKERVASAMADAGGRFSNAWRWITGSTIWAFRLRVGAAVLLLTWGTVDQARHYLALQSDDLSSLKRAARLNAFDSQLQARLGRRELEGGNAREAEAAWRRAIAENPADPGARQALLKFLLDEKRFDEAYALTEASLKYSPKDANLLVNRGLLALQLGKADEAVADWEQALKIDPHDALADLYLARELDGEGQGESASVHYASYLAKLAEHPEDKPAADVLIGIVLRMADCQVRAQQSDRALKSFHMAEKLAQQTGQMRLESIADMNAAPLQAQAGQVNEALRLYRRALELDEGIGDKAAGAVDWFAYGQFLDQAGFPARLAYACMLQSESLARSLTKSPIPASAAETRRALEKRLGVEAAKIQRNPDQSVREAWSVQR
ncbi:MAG TPA: tetratricopeptide repeat protein [Dongiaceae bacterium]|nr:tetratricopeptide repeat protein [Dongiaceae bacterium]